MLKVGLEYIWLWIAIEPKNKQILALTISKERNMFVAEHFLAGIVREYGKHVSSFYRWWYMVSNGL
jgi:transposase-like protein